MVSHDYDDLEDIARRLRREECDRRERHREITRQLRRELGGREVRPRKLSLHPLLTLATGILVGVTLPPAIFLFAYHGAWEGLRFVGTASAVIAFLWWGFSE